MIYLFITLNFTYFLMSKVMYEKNINPLSLYVVIWSSIVLLHESGLIYFYDLSLTTWITIIFSEVLYILGVLIGNRACKRIKYHVNEIDIDKVTMKRIILLLSIPSLLSTVINLVNSIRTGGLFFIRNIYNTYMNSILTQSGSVSIIGNVFESLVFFAVALSSLYIVKYGFEKIILLPLISLVLGQLSNGSRGTLVVAIVIFTSLIILNKIGIKKDRGKIRNVIIITGILFIAITYFRGVTVERIEFPYASEFFKRICGNSKLLYSIFSYIVSPIGVLNQYIENPVSGTWGGTTFRVFNKLLFNLGIINEFDDRAEFPTYLTPKASNVGTYLAELIRDFDYAGMFFVCFMLGFVFAYSYRRMIKNKSVIHSLLCTVWFTLVVLSFFAWYMRIMGMWIIILISLVIFLGKKILPRKRIVIKK